MLGPLPYWNGFIALNSLQNNDEVIYCQQADHEGNFEIKDVPPGEYLLTYWDSGKLYLLNQVGFTIDPNTPAAGVDLGTLYLGGWYTNIYGTIFEDQNEDGKFDPTERGIYPAPAIPAIMVSANDTDAAATTG